MVKTDVTQRGIYNDLLRLFRNKGHEVYIVSPSERREGKKTSLVENDCVHTLNVHTLNVQKTNIIEKGLGQVSIEFLYKHAIRKYFGDVQFDLLLYSTPPITLMGVVADLKRRCPKVMTYLLLKDIFPQNAVDMGMMGKTGVKGILYRYFRNQEKKLYKVSDRIGCMSPANVKYVLEHNKWIDPSVVEVAPNSVELVESNVKQSGEPAKVLKKYNLPTDRPIFIYGGNLGKPQGIPFLMECLDANKDRTDLHFVAVGTGTYYKALADWSKSNPKTCVTVMSGLPKDDYDELVRACDVGLVFLDYNFTIPNFPSRLLSYLENKMPVICATDPVCDMGAIAGENGFGIWAPSNSVKAFTEAVDRMLASDIKRMGEKGYEFMKNNYLVEHTYNQIVKHIRKHD